MQLIKAGLCLWLLVLASVTFADPFKGFDAYVERAMQDWQIPGMALVVIDDGEIIYSQAYGCLLYTSPSPRDKRQSRMPSSA